MSDDLTDIISSLRAKRADHLKSVGVLDEAIEALTRLVGGRPVNSVDRSAPRQEHGEERPAPERLAPRQPAPTKSVPNACLTLAKEKPRDWSAEEIVKEYANRGTPLAVMDPMNSVFSALSRLTSKGKLVRTSPGRYAALEFADQLAQVEKDPLDRPFTETGRFTRIEEEMRGRS